MYRGEGEVYLHVKLSAVLGQGHMLQGGSCCLAYQLPWDQIAVVLSNADKHLHAHAANSVPDLPPDIRKSVDTDSCQVTDMKSAWQSNLVRS